MLCLFKQLQNRLPENVEVLQKTSLFAVSAALNRATKTHELRQLLQEFKEPDDEIGVIEIQYSKLPLISWIEKTNTLLFWNEVRKCRDAAGLNPFKELVDFAIRMLVLPYSNATVERIFSQMNIVKNKQRNRMQTEMVNAILTIRFGLRRHEKCCHDYVFPNDVLRKVISYENDKNSDVSADELEVLVSLLNRDDE